MRAGTIPVRLIANCIAHVPRGSAIGEYYGGALAITAETEALWEISYLIAKTNAKKPSSVKPRKMPIGVKEQQARERKATAAASRYLAKQEWAK